MSRTATASSDRGSVLAPDLPVPTGKPFCGRHCGRCGGRTARSCRSDLNSLWFLPPAYTARRAKQVRGGLLQPLRVKTKTSNTHLFLMVNETHALPYGPIAQVIWKTQQNVKTKKVNDN